MVSIGSTNKFYIWFNSRANLRLGHIADEVFIEHQEGKMIQYARSFSIYAFIFSSLGKMACIMGML